MVPNVGAHPIARRGGPFPLALPRKRTYPQSFVRPTFGGFEQPSVAAIGFGSLRAPGLAVGIGFGLRVTGRVGTGSVMPAVVSTCALPVNMR